MQQLFYYKIRQKFITKCVTFITKWVCTSVDISLMTNNENLRNYQYI